MLLKDRGTGTVLASGTVPPDSFAAGQLNRVQLTVRGAEATALINGVQAVSGPAGTAAGSGFGLRVSGGGAYFQNVRADDVASYMNGLYQPGYHYSQLIGSTSDPNGLVYYDGEYHLFHQDQGRWAHAVSTDLVHWRPCRSPCPGTPTATAGPAARSWTPTTPPVSSTAARA